MPLTGPELGDGIALSIGVDLAMILQIWWKAASQLWPPAQHPPSLADSADSCDSLASGKQAAAAEDISSGEVSSSGQRSGAKWLAICSKRQLGRLVDSQLLPTAALGAAAAVCLGAAAFAGGWLLRCVAGYACAELGFQGYQCWR